MAGPTQPTRSKDLRDGLLARVVADLLGPVGGPDEEIADGTVRDRYLVGVLAPRQRLVRQEELEGLSVAGDGSREEGAVEAETPAADTLFPSSIGMTFSVAADAIRIRAAWGRYERKESEHLVSERTGNPLTVWKRHPMAGVSATITLRDGPLPPWRPNDGQPEVQVRGLVRKVGDEWIVTLFLVNGQGEQESRKDETWLFQPELSVESPDGKAVFVRRPRRPGGRATDDGSQDEETAMSMLHRRHVEFAVGHGVAVHADVAPDDPTRATRISTKVVPAYEVPATTQPTGEERPALATLALDMQVLAESSSSELAQRLRALPDAYRAWIREERASAESGAAGLPEYRDAADAAVARCEEACARIEAGIALVGRDDMAAEAFRFANWAMWQQRIRSAYAERVRRKEKASVIDLDVPANRSWRPFQLAFLLLNLPSVTDLAHEDRTDEARAGADLLWFPTGGGKTEAYLGLAAYVMGLRRLQGEVAGRRGDAGVAVLMRYTLRLLTIQQFQRAAALICACEKFRRDAAGRNDLRWGATPFRIGLWVGGRVTPNRTADAEEALRQTRGGGKPGGGGRGEPQQLTTCPWCGSEIVRGRDLTVHKGLGRTLVYCGDQTGMCPFSQKQAKNEGIPAVVVDEEIYHLLPALVIATVDKFAQMPWKGETRLLFGHVQKRCDRCGFVGPDEGHPKSHPKTVDLPPADVRDHAALRPPDLIIQDELHLISGPLGTLVGLYETAVDALCSWKVDGKTVRPKVIASTATIRRAAEQVHGVFLRRVRVFPPHGTDIRDNFFAVQREDRDEHPGRLYLGICAPGRRLKAAQIRVYVAFLAAAQQLYEQHGKDVDPWMTLVGYFNSLRELGGMRRLVADDVRQRLRNAVERGLANRRIAPEPKELTSRMRSAEIPRTLDLLEVPFDPIKLERQKKLKERDFQYPIDVLLATNMISVGVDVQRLGLMVVSGQPKNTAEYIQATSRVGRRAPGIVCTILNWARPRDLSHYETFEHYHATFYQHVEALSVTPFAVRALDRGLTAVLVSMMRLAEQEMAGNLGAGGVEAVSVAADRIVAAIEHRAAQVTQNKDYAGSVAAMARARLDEWRRAAANKAGGRSLGYKASKQQGGTVAPLLVYPDDASGDWKLFTCLNSLRDVEPTVGLVFTEPAAEKPAAPAAEVAS